MAQSFAMFRITKAAVNALAKSNSGALASASLQAKAYSSAATTKDKEKAKSKISKSVFISQSADVFTNLAFEDWLYQNFDFTNHHVLFLWRNSPCVVIGRHQNPWLEANTTNVAHQGMEIARRNSGGGTVYHDRGNLNLTFFTPKESYNRRNNLEIITRALFREWGIHSEISPREDIIVKGSHKQISGTAAKLGRPNAYHHCTLLVDVNKVNLHQSLHKQDKGIVTNATPSVAAPIMNLCEVNHQVTVEGLLGAVGWEYLRTCPHSLEDGGQEQISKQRGFQLINPTEEWFPGLDKIRQQFTSWDWRYGKTPKFQVKRSFRVPKEFLEEGEQLGAQEVQVSLEVNKGIINDVTLKIPPGFMSANGFHGEVAVATSLRGQPFSERAVMSLENALHDLHEGDLEQKSKFVMNCMRQVMQSV